MNKPPRFAGLKNKRFVSDVLARAVAGVVRFAVSSLIENRRIYPMRVPLEPLVSIIAGILILAFPRLLNYVIALYLILTGLYGFLH